MEPIKVFFLVFLILMVMRAPMYLCLLGSSLLYIYLTPQLSMMTAMNKMMNAPNSFTLLAVPFFIFAGQVMNNGGVTDRIFGFAKKMIGHWSGGLAYVNVLSSLIFSGISGSALADVGGLGMIEIKAMRDEKYDDDLTLGVTGLQYRGPNHTAQYSVRYIWSNGKCVNRSPFYGRPGSWCGPVYRLMYLHIYHCKKEEISQTRKGIRT